MVSNCIDYVMLGQKSQSALIKAKIELNNMSDPCKFWGQKFMNWC